MHNHSDRTDNGDSSLQPRRLAELLDIVLPANLYVARLKHGQVIETHVGQALAGLFGYETDELEAHANIWRDIIHPADRNRINIAWDDLLKGKPFSEVYRVFRKDGQMEWIRHSSAPHRNESGEIDRIVGIMWEASYPSHALEYLPEYRIILDNIPSAVVIRDVSGRLIYCNQAYVDIFSFETPDDMIGTTLSDILDRDYARQFESEVQPILFRGPWMGDITMKLVDGRCVDLQIATNVLRDQFGSPFAMYGVGVEVTDLRNAERALRSSELQLRQFIEHMPAAVAMFDVDMRYLVASKRWLSDYKLGDTDILGHSVYDLYPDLSDHAKETFKHVLAGNVVECEEHSFIGASGKKEWIRWELHPWWDEDGDIGGLIMYTELITYRKESEEALRTSEEKYRTLLENVDAIVYRMDSKMMPIALAGNVKQMTGFTVEELMEHPEEWFLGVHPQDRKRMLDFLKSMKKSKLPGSIYFRVCMRDGGLRWIHSHLSPVFDENGHVEYFDGVDIDITDRMEAQQLERRHMARVSALAKVSQDISSSLNIDHIIENTVSISCETIDCHCVVTQVDHDGYIKFSVKEKSFQWKLKRESEHLRLTINDMFIAGKPIPLLNPDLSRFPKLAEIMRRLDIGPAVFVPVYSEGELFGILMALREIGREEFDDEDFWYFSEVGSYLSSALTNAAVYQRQTRIAETLQRSLIPSSSEVECLDIATLYLPALGEAGVGGDFFDIIDYGDCKTGIVVGDVSGKGIEAAVHTAEAKYMLRGYAMLDHDPGNVMTTLNKAMCIYLSDFTFVTLIYILIDAKAHKVVYANAGHEPALILQKDTRQIQELSPNGPVLGVMKDYIYTSVTKTLDEDSILFTHTDGVTDVPRGRERFGYPRLMQTVADASAQSPEQLLEHVMSIVRDYGNGYHPDDQVVVVVSPSNNR